MRTPAHYLKAVFSALREIHRLSAKVDRMESSLNDLKLLMSASLTASRGKTPVDRPLDETEFKVFSQFGDDGIIQHLMGHLDLPGRLHTFVEFGVEDYLESQTRLLLLKDYWRGLIFDGSAEAIESVKHRLDFWHRGLTAEKGWISRENINQLIRNHGFSGEIGLLVVDIDGNDYWVWEAVETVNPIVVVSEYNNTFGPDLRVSIPYDPNFQRRSAHPSQRYYGASLGALTFLAEKKGYRLVGSNRAGNNAFFVRKDRIGSLPKPSVAEAYREAVFKENDEQRGFLHWRERLPQIAELPVVDVTSNRTVLIRELMEMERPRRAAAL